MNDKFEKLKETLLEEHGLELLNRDVKTIREVIKTIKNDTGYEDYSGRKDSIVLGMEELEAFEIYDCILAVDEKYGAMNGMKYVILDDDLEIIGFVRII